MRLLLKLFIPVTLLTYLCIIHVDRQVSLFIHGYFYANKHWAKLTSTLPDLLLILVVVVSMAAGIGYFYRKEKLLIDANTRMMRLIAVSLPLSFIAKFLLKVIFGRVATRYWLKNQQLYDFHWLNGGGSFSGFPSGHMLVFVTLFAAIGRYRKDYRMFCYLLSGVLALLLIATNYHFVGDVIYGAYIGLLIECYLAEGLAKMEGQTGRGKAFS